MLICKKCIEKSLPAYTYENENFEIHFCKECQIETQHLDYEIFKNKLFEIISNNYRFLRDLPWRSGWFFEGSDEDGVSSFDNLIESLELSNELIEKLLEDGEKVFHDELLVNPNRG